MKIKTILALCALVLAGCKGARALEEVKSEVAAAAMPYNLITLYDRETDKPTISIQGFCDLEGGWGPATDIEAEDIPLDFVCQTGPTAYENYNFLLFESTSYTVEEVETPTTNPYKVILTPLPVQH
jgi:hypothetical protein